jgi:hypothetical protein
MGNSVSLIGLSIDRTKRSEQLSDDRAASHRGFKLRNKATFTEESPISTFNHLPACFVLPFVRRAMD